jgi:hypothetical protein
MALPSRTEYLTSFRLQPLYPTQSPALSNKWLDRPQQQPMYVGEKRDFCLWWEKNPNRTVSILSYTGSHYVYINIMLCHIYTVTDPDERSKEETERKYLEIFSCGSPIGKTRGSSKPIFKNR